ncbi:MAG: zinc-binding dehydrogenase [FCB group bacterium]|nr:zinc-binding dehydrogenase [FCB group bacterium]
MHQVQIISYGGPDRLQSVNLPLAEPRENEVTIEVHYAGINFADIMCRIGLYPNAPKPPFAPGYEVSGTIIEVGSRVETSLVGKPVLALTPFGGYSTHVTIPRSRIILLEDESEYRWSVALPVNFLTAQLMLFRQAALRSGDFVLIYGIGGGVGIAALQLAQKAGAYIIGTASQWKHERLREMGVEHLIDPKNENLPERVKTITEGKGVDVILDPIGGRNLKQSYRLLNTLGRLVVYGFSTAATPKRNWFKALREYRAIPRFNPLKLMQDNKGVFGFHLGYLWERETELSTILTGLLKQVREKELAVVIDREFPLDNAAAAHRYIHDRKNFGKIILNCRDASTVDIPGN